MSFCPVQASKTNVMDILPKGYTSTFLIRNPKYTVPSHYKMCTNPDKSGKKLYHSFNSKKVIACDGSNDVLLLIFNKCENIPSP